VKNDESARRGDGRGLVRALLGVCQVSERSLAVARVFSDAFAEDPRLAEAVRDSHRYAADRAAARAGCGRSPDAAHLWEAERAWWRGQARGWVRAHLAAWGSPRPNRIAIERRGRAETPGQTRGAGPVAGAGRMTPTSAGMTRRARGPYRILRTPRPGQTEGAA